MSTYLKERSDNKNGKYNTGSKKETTANNNQMHCHYKSADKIKQNQIKTKPYNSANKAKKQDLIPILEESKSSHLISRGVKHKLSL